MAFALRSVREPPAFGAIVFSLASLPMLYALLGVASDLVFHTRYFGANPIRTSEHYLGLWAFHFLLMTLAVTPLRQVTGWTWLARQRRTLGLFAFAYLTAHWLVYAVLDVQLDWHDLMVDLTKRPYIMVGMAGLIGMLVLAATSTRNMMRRLGRRWGQLHRLVYLVAVLGLVHHFMAVKKDITEPLIHTAILALLLGTRVVFAWRRRVA